jgi:hypothetical protein
MPERIPDIGVSSIVLVGSFNPAIFQPAWFGRQNLLPQAEADDAEKILVHQQISQFETERFIVQVTTDRFSASNKPNTNPVPLRDLVLGAFFILEHTPLRAMGLNRQMHFSIDSEEAWHALGDKLAPKEAWDEALAGRSGMLSLSILRQLAEKEKITVKVEPSIQVKPRGAYFETNHHFDSSEKDGSKLLMDTLRERWEQTQSHASKIANYVLDWATK